MKSIYNPAAGARPSANPFGNKKYKIVSERQESRKPIQQAPRSARELSHHKEELNKQLKPKLWKGSGL